MNNAIGTVLFSLITLAITVVLIKNLSGGGAWLKEISPSLPSNWRDFLKYPAVLMGCAWFLAVVAALCLHPVLCWQAVTQYPGLVLGFHAILLIFALMWRKEGSNAGKWFLTIVLVVAFLSALGGKNLLPKVPSFRTGQKRMVVGRPKQEPVVLTSTFKLKPGEYVGPIKAPSETEPWEINFWVHRRIHVKLIDKQEKTVWEADMGPGLPRAQGPGFRPGSSFYATSLEGEHDIDVEWTL